jgi:hypothetical protein
VVFLPGGPQFTKTVIPTVNLSQKKVEIWGAGRGREGWRGREGGRKGGVVAVSFQGRPVSALKAANP